ncbi:MAG: hypothetical protein ACKOPC_02725 [Methylocystis sp.]
MRASTATPRFILIFDAAPPVMAVGFVPIKRSDVTTFLGQILLLS